MVANSGNRSSIRMAPRWWRPAAVGLVAAVGLALLLSPPGRSLAADLLRVFRVQKVTTVSVSPSDIPDIPGLSDLSAFGSLQVSQRVSTQTVGNVEEAAQRVGFPPRLPTVLPAGLTVGPGKIVVHEGVFLSYTFDLPKMKQALESAGLGGIQLPAALDGATVRGTIPPSVLVTYGEGDVGLVVGQARSPILELPSEVDFDSLRLQLLQAYGEYSPQVASQLLSIQDWKSTLVIPVPQEGVRQEVSVDGVQGTLIESPQGKHLASAVLWEKDGVLYGVAGLYPGGELLKVANSLR